MRNHTLQPHCYLPWRSNTAVRQPLPPLLPHPQHRVEGRSAGLAGCQLSHLASGSPASWASMVRGNVSSRIEERASPRQQPAVTPADFTSLYEFCVTGGLKAGIVLSYISGRQIVNLSCSLPAPNKAANAPAKRAAAAAIAILRPPLLWTKTAQQPVTTCRRRHLHHQPPPATDHSSANTYTNNTTLSTGKKEKV